MCAYRHGRVWESPGNVSQYNLNVEGMPLTMFAFHRFEFGQSEGVSVPPFKKISAGFDGVFQVRSDVLEELLSARLPFLSQKILFSTLTLPNSVQNAVDSALANLRNQSETSLADVVLGEKFGGSTITITPASLHISLRNPTISPVDRSPTAVDVVWQVGIELVASRSHSKNSGLIKKVLEKVFGPHLGEPVSEPPPGIDKLLEHLAEPKQQTVSMCQGKVKMRGDILVATDSKAYKAYARLVLSNEQPEIAARDDLFSQLIEHKISKTDTLSSIIASILSGVINGDPIRVTPEFSLFGRLKIGEAIAQLPHFSVQHVTTSGNDATHWVLSICVNVRPPGAEGSVDLIRPFVKDRNFAFFLSDEIIAASLANRWKRTEIPKQIAGEVPIHGSPDGRAPSRYLGRAKVQVTLRQLDEIALFASAADDGDGLRIAGGQTIRLLKLWDDKDNELEIDKLSGTEWDGIDDPVDEAFLLNVFPFSDKSVELTHQGTAFIHLDLGAPWLEALYRPFQDDFPVVNLEGRLSAPCRGMFSRGDLDLSSVGIQALLTSNELGTGSKAYGFFR